MANDDSPKKTAFRATVKIGEADIGFDEIIDLSISAELDLPDAFVLTLGKGATEAIVPKLKLSNRIEAHLSFVGDDEDFAFIGELTGIEPIFSERGSYGGFTVLRGYNAMHGLSRGKYSHTYLTMTDKEIVTQVLQRANSELKPVFDEKTEPKIKYDHVYQYNKTNLQFILDRAKRTGYSVFVRDKQLFYQKRDPTPSKLTLKSTAARKSGDDKDVISLEEFKPWLSTANQVTEVIARTWNPKTRKELIGRAPQPGAGTGGAQLGSKPGKGEIEERYPDSVMVHTKTPFATQDEGNAIAAAILEERLLSYVTADGSVPGDPRLKPGLVVTVETGNAQFDGKYYLTRVRHRYRTGDRHPFTTDFHAKRDAVEAPASADGAAAPT